MLVIEPSERISSEQALMHPFVWNFVSNEQFAPGERLPFDEDNFYVPVDRTPQQWMGE